jgi:hypothetical protein
MLHRVHGRAPLAALVLAALWVAPTAASAADAPTWQCRASAYHHSVAGNPAFEPIKADPVPCAAASAGLAQVPSTLSVPVDVVSTGTVSAATTLEPAGAASAQQAATATGRVENLVLNLHGATSLVLRARAANASASASCQSGRPALTASSELVGLSLNGDELPLSEIVDRVNASLAPLNQIVEIRRDEQAFSGGSLVRRALHVRVLNAAGTPLLDAVAGEAVVGASGAVCSASGTGATLPPNACPNGSQYDPARNLCVIGGSSVLGEQDRGIVVGRPFEGPSGGTVLSLAQARQRYGDVRCLRGSGPAFAIVGTKGADLITGTNKRDRILALGGNDRVDGGRGDDCIDGGTGRDVLSGALGADRLFGMSGNDSLNGGPGSDMLSGGSGDDTLNAAYGRDHVLGGSGRDFVNVATAGPAATVSCGSGRDKVRANYNERSRVHGCETKYVLRDRPSLAQRS